MNTAAQFKAFLEKHSDFSPATVKNYIVDLNHFIAWYEKSKTTAFNPSQVSLEDITKFREEKSSALSEPSLKRHLSSLKKYFHYLKMEGQISQSPLEDGPKNIKTESDPFLLKEFKNFLYIYNASPLTIKNYVIDVKQFLSWLATIHPGEPQNPALFAKVSSELLEEYKTRLMANANFSASSVNRKLSSLRRYFSWANEQGLITQSVGADVSQRLIKVPVKQNGESKSIPAQPEELSVFRKFINLPVAIFDMLLTEPFAYGAGKAKYFVWKLRGKPIFKFSQKDITPKLGVLKNGQIKVSNVKKEFYAPSKMSLRSLPVHHRLFFHIRHTRPNWYKKHQNAPLAIYFQYAVVIIMVGALAFGFYNAFVKKPGNEKGALAAPTAPPRVMSFQGRLTDNSDNPITATQYVRFSLYSDSTATGSGNLLWQEVDTISPDSDGIFSTLLGSGSSCSGQPLTVQESPCAIDASVFTDNQNLYLGIAIGTSAELTPRQQVATVAFASNAESLQGLVPTTQAGLSSYTNTVLALDGTAGSPTLTIGGSVGATFQATGGEFVLSGKPLTLTTQSNGNIKLNPDGLGKIDLEKPLQNLTNTGNASTVPGAVEVDDEFAVLATSSGRAAVTINQDGAGPILVASASGTERFSVFNGGSIKLSGTAITAANLTSFQSSSSLSLTATTFNLGNGSAATIGTVSDDNLSIVPNGSGNLNLATTNTGNVSIGNGTGTVALTLGSDLEGDIYYRNSGGTLSRLGVGSSGSVLSSNGTIPTWATSSGTGAIGYWTRTGTVLSPTNSGDSLSIAATATTGNVNVISDASLAPAAAATANNLHVAFTNNAANTSGTSITTGLNVAGTNSASGAGGTMETYGIRIQDIAGTPANGTQINYGLRIGNQGESGAETAYGVYVDTQSGAATNNFSAIFAGGNVGIGDTTPQALLTVGTSDAFQIDSSGNITTSGDTAINGGDITTSASSFNLATSASNIFLGSPTGSASTSATLTLGGSSGTIRSGYGPLNLAYKSAANTWANALTIQDSTGVIGIGTTPDSTALLNVAWGSQSANTTSYTAEFSKTITGALTADKTSYGIYNSLTNSADDATFAHDVRGLYNYTNLSSGHTVDTQFSGFFENRLNSSTLAPDTSLTATNSAGLYSTSHLDAAGSVTSNQGIYTAGYNNAGGTIASNYGIRAVGYNNSTGSVTDNYGGYFRSYNNNATGTITNAYGGYGSAETNTTNAAVTNAYGLYANVATSSATTTGGITNAYGVYSNNTSRINTAAYAFYGNITGAGVGTNYGLYLNVKNSVTHNYGIYIDNSNVKSGDYGIYEAATSQNYFAGNVGIGDSTPAAPLTVGSSDAFQVDSSGNISTTGTTGLTMTGTDSDITFSTGTGNHDITASAGTLRLGAITLTGTVTGGNQNISSIGNITANSSSNTITGFGTVGTGGTTAFLGTGLNASGTSSTSIGNSTGTITTTGSGITNNTNSVLYVGASGVLGTATTTSTGLCLLSNGASSDPSWQTCPGGSGTNYLRINQGALSPVNDTLDFLVGANATSSAKFAFINVNSGNPTASISGNLALTVPTTAGSNTFDLLNNSTLNFRVSQGGNAGLTSALFIDKQGNSGKVGIANSSPKAQLDVTGTASISGTLTLGDGSTNVLRSPYGPLTLQYKSAANTWADAVTIQDTTGNIGIAGVTNPSAFKLQVAGDVGPNADDTYYLGSASKRWKGIYATDITVTNLHAGTTDAAGTTSDTFTINSDNATADGEDSILAFERGSTTPNATITWNSASDRFDFSNDLNVSGGLTASGTVNFSGLTASKFVGTDGSKNLTTASGAETSAALLDILSDETGSGVAVFGTSPQITTSLTTTSSSFDLLNANATTINFGGAATTVNLGASSLSLLLGANATIYGGAGVGNSLTLNGTNNGNHAGSYVVLQPSGGNVGVATTAPDSLFDINLGTSGNLQLTYNDSNGSATTYSRFGIDSSGNLTIDNTGTKTIVADDLQVTGNDILSSSATALTLSGSDVTVAGDLTITGNDITNTTLNLGGGSAVTLGTVSSDNLSIIPNGTGGLNLATTNTGNVAIGNGTGTVALTLGSDATGDIYYRSSGGVLARLAVSGTAGAVLTSSGTLPQWSTPSGTGTIGYWSRSGTTLSPANSGDAITTTGNISTTSTGTITSAGTLTGSNGLTLSTGALSLTGTSGSIALTGYGTTSITSTTTTGNINTRADSSFAVAASATGNLMNYTFSNGSTNTSGTAVTTGLNIAGTNNAAGSGGTMETYGIRIQNIAGTVGAGTQNNYGIRIGNQGQSNAETSYGLYVDAQSGSATANYAAVLAGGNVGLGITTPNYALDIATTNNTVDGINVANLSNGTAAQTRLQLFNDRNSTSSMGFLSHYGTGNTLSAFGVTLADYTLLADSGANANGLILGTLNSDPILFGVNSAEIARFDTSGRLGLGTTNPLTGVELGDQKMLASAYGGLGRFENYLLQSEDFSTSWTTTGLTVTANNTAAPDGQTTADKLLDATAAGTAATQAYASAGNSQTYTFSVWLKNDSSNAPTTYKISLTDNGTGATTDTTTITASTTTQTWQRYSVTHTTASASVTSVTASIDVNASNNNTSYIYAWGGQLEKQSAVGVYAKTTTTAQTTTGYGITTNDNLVVAGNVGIGTSPGSENLSINTGLTAAATGVKIQGSDSHFIRLLPSAGNANYNSLVSSGDEVLVYGGATVGSGSFDLVPWLSGTGGIHMDSSGNVSVGSSTTTSMFNVGTSAQFQVSSSGAISTSVGGDAINLTNATNNRIVFPTAGVAAPTSGAAGNGERITLYGSGSTNKYAVGIENSNMWFQTDIGFKWYEDTTLNMNLKTGGTLDLSNGGIYQISGTNVLSSSTLGSGVTASSLTSVGALSSGSISSGFGNTLPGGILGTTKNFSGSAAGAPTSGISFGWNLSNGQGEGDILFSQGAGSVGGLRFYDWNGTTATLAVTFSKTGGGTFVGALSSTTLDTGLGAHELYAMDQDVTTTSTPTFGTTTINGNVDLATGDWIGLSASTAQINFVNASPDRIELNLAYVLLGSGSPTTLTPANGSEYISGSLEVGTNLYLTGISAATTDRATLCVPTGGGGTVTSDAAGNNCDTSSLRYKHDIENLDYGLDQIMQLRPVSFVYNDDQDPTSHGTRTARRLGFIAEEVSPIIPEAIGLDTEGRINSVDYVHLISLAIKGIQQQQLEIQNNQSGIASLSADLSVSNSGNLNVTQQNPGQYIVQNNGSDVSRISGFAEAVVAKVRAGLVSAQDITTNTLNVATDSVTVAGKQLSQYISDIVDQKLANQQNQGSNIAKTDQIQTKSASDSAHLSVKLNDKDGKSALEVQNASGSAVATIDSTGKLTAEKIVASQLTLTHGLQVNGDATISGVLRAQKIIADQIEGLTLSAATVSATYITNNYYGATESASASPSGELAASGSANLISGSAIFENGIAAFGPSSLSDLTLTGQLAVGSQLVLADNTVNVLGGNLEIQPLRQGNVSFMGDLVSIDTEGNLRVAGNANFARDVSIQGTLTANEIAPYYNKDLVIRLGGNDASSSAKLVVKNASGSAVLSIDTFGNLTASGAAQFAKLNLDTSLASPSSKTRAIATGSAGMAIIQPGQTRMTITNKLVTENSLIYITPRADTTYSGQPYIELQNGEDPANGVEGSFTVKINRTIATDMPFNWVIIN